MENKKKEYNKKYYQKNREERIKKSKEYYRKNKEKRIEYQLDYEEKNKEKIVEYKKQYHIKNRSKHLRNYRNNDLKRKYNITIDEYEIMLINQNMCCAICGDHFENLNVDHNHDTGEIRELLCGNCNKGLGNFQDNINTLVKAIEYLKKHSDVM